MSAGQKARELWWEIQSKENERKLFLEMKALKEEVKNFRYEIGALNEAELKAQKIARNGQIIMNALLKHLFG